MKRTKPPYGTKPKRPTLPAKVKQPGSHGSKIRRMADGGFGWGDDTQFKTVAQEQRENMMRAAAPRAAGNLAEFGSGGWSDSTPAAEGFRSGRGSAPGSVGPVITDHSAPGRYRPMPEMSPTGVQSMKGTGMGTKGGVTSSGTPLFQDKPATQPATSNYTPNYAPVPKEAPSLVGPQQSTLRQNPFATTVFNTAMSTNYGQPNPLTANNPDTVAAWRAGRRLADGKSATSVKDGTHMWGMVEGPGGPREDKVGPAKLPGSGEQALLSDGEAVLPADVVQSMNRDFFQNDPDGVEKYSLVNHKTPANKADFKERVQDVGGPMALRDFAGSYADGKKARKCSGGKAVLRLQDGGLVAGAYKAFDNIEESNRTKEEEILAGGDPAQVPMTQVVDAAAAAKKAEAERVAEANLAAARAEYASKQGGVSAPTTVAEANARIEQMNAAAAAKAAADKAAYDAAQAAKAKAAEESKGILGFFQDGSPLRKYAGGKPVKKYVDGAVGSVIKPNPRVAAVVDAPPAQPWTTRVQTYLNRPLFGTGAAAAATDPLPLPEVRNMPGGKAQAAVEGGLNKARTAVAGPVGKLLRGAGKAGGLYGMYDAVYGDDPNDSLGDRVAKGVGGAAMFLPGAGQVVGTGLMLAPGIADWAIEEASAAFLDPKLRQAGIGAPAAVTQQTQRGVPQPTATGAASGSGGVARPPLRDLGPNPSPLATGEVTQDGPNRFSGTGTPGTSQEIADQQTRRAEQDARNWFRGRSEKFLRENALGANVRWNTLQQIAAERQAQAGTQAELLKLAREDIKNASALRETRASETMAAVKQFAGDNKKLEADLIAATGRYEPYLATLPAASRIAAVQTLMGFEKNGQPLDPGTVDRILRQQNAIRTTTGPDAAFGTVVTQGNAEDLWKYFNTLGPLGKQRYDATTGELYVQHPDADYARLSALRGTLPR